MRSKCMLLRKCNMDDCDLIYKWANDDEVRKNAFNTSKISYKEHCIWYRNSLNNYNRKMYIAAIDNKEVGQIRLDIEDGKAIISYSISKEYRGIGCGSMMLSKIKEHEDEEINMLEGLVKKENIASRRAFLNNGFIEYEESDCFRYVFFLKEGIYSEGNKDQR